MLPASPLESLEAAVAELQSALAESRPETVEERAHAVRIAMVNLADWLANTPQNQWPANTAARTQRMGAQLNDTREQLARVLAITGKQAASLLPPVEVMTYGPGPSGKASAYRPPQ